MAVDIKNLNNRQLDDLINKARQRQDEMRRDDLAKLREKINAMISEEGYTFEDIFGGARAGKGKRAKSPVAPKYQNPQNSEQTWSGRGKRPRWFHEALASGKKEQDLLI